MFTLLVDPRLFERRLRMPVTPITANHTTGNDTGTWSSWLDEDACARKLDLCFMRNCLVDNRNRHEMLLGNISCFRDCRLDIGTLLRHRHQPCFCDYQRRRVPLKREPTSTTDDACDTVDVDDNFFKFLWRLWRLVATVIASTTSTLRTTTCTYGRLREVWLVLGLAQPY